MPIFTEMKWRLGKIIFAENVFDVPGLSNVKLVRKYHLFLRELAIYYKFSIMLVSSHRESTLQPWLGTYWLEWVLLL